MRIVCLCFICWTFYAKSAFANYANSIDMASSLAPSVSATPTAGFTSISVETSHLLIRRSSTSSILTWKVPSNRSTSVTSDATNFIDSTFLPSQKASTWTRIESTSVPVIVDPPKLAKDDHVPLELASSFKKAKTANLYNYHANHTNSSRLVESSLKVSNIYGTKKMALPSISLSLSINTLTNEDLKASSKATVDDSRSVTGGPSLSAIVDPFAELKLPISFQNSDDGLGFEGENYQDQNEDSVLESEDFFRDFHTENDNHFQEFIPDMVDPSYDIWHGIEVEESLYRGFEANEFRKDQILKDPPNLPTIHQTTRRLPSNFIWGLATSATQIEGAAKEDGRGPSVWDVLSHKIPGFIKDNSTFDVACSHYYLHKVDAQRLKALGVPYYSMTISWSRILPFGSGAINYKGLQHYVDEIDYLRSLGIKPIVTLFHWDTPYELQLKYGGWLNKQIIDDFVNYAEIVFGALGSKVDIWFSYNEPEIFCQDYADWPTDGVSDSLFPTFGLNRLQRKYHCGHHALLAHARVAKLFRTKFGKTHPGKKISFIDTFAFVVPSSPSSNDRDASERQMVFDGGWFGDPVYFGDYPQQLRTILPQNVLPVFSDDEKELIKGSTDFYALDIYTGTVAGWNPEFKSCVNNVSDPEYPECVSLSDSLLSGWQLGSKADEAVGWLMTTPDQFRDGILWVWNRYAPKEVMVMEYGVSVQHEDDSGLTNARVDDARIFYYQTYIEKIVELVNDYRVNITGAISWSAMDNIEWREGKRVRFGLQYVDYDTMIRSFKKSAFYLRNVFTTLMENTKDERTNSRDDKPLRRKTKTDPNFGSTNFGSQLSSDLQVPNRLKFESLKVTSPRTIDLAPANPSSRQHENPIIGSRKRVPESGVNAVVPPATRSPSTEAESGSGGVDRRDRKNLWSLSVETFTTDKTMTNEFLESCKDE